MTVRVLHTCLCDSQAAHRRSASSCGESVSQVCDAPSARAESITPQGKSLAFNSGVARRYTEHRERYGR
jgi:hypothetical protein